MLKRFIIMLLVAVITVMFVSPLFAQNMTRKLGRGVANILSAPLEVPIQMMKETKDNGDFNGLFVGGSRGFINMLSRFFAGIYEIVTFPIPFPEDYTPVFEPEFVIEGDLLAF